MSPQSSSCRLGRVTAVLRVPESLSSASLRSHRVSVESLVLKDFFSGKHTPCREDAHTLLSQLSFYTYNYSRSVQSKTCSNQTSKKTKKKKKKFAYPWNTAPAKCPPPVMRTTHTVFLLTVFKADPASCSSSDLSITGAEK